MNETRMDVPPDRRGRALSRRKLLTGAAVLGVGVGSWAILKKRKVRCYLSPETHLSDGDFAAVTAREDIFTDAPFAQCHASTLAEPLTGAGGSLVAAWFGGSEEGASDVAIWTAIRGETGWSAPERVAIGRGPADGQLPCWNPVLWQDPEGPLHLFYRVGETPKTWWTMRMLSGDGGWSWGAPELLPDGILGPIKNKPVLLADGRLIAPSSSEHDGRRVHFEISEDRGMTWRRTGSFGGKNLQIIQPTLLVLGDGRLQALCRSKQERIVGLWSEDGGETWSAPVLTELGNPNSGIDGVTLADGRHLLVHNPGVRCRSPLVVSISEDGRQWRRVGTLEREEGEFSYPAVIQRADGMVAISYTNRRRTITQVTLDPAVI